MTKNEKDPYQWIEKAEHDLIAAQTILEYNPVIMDIACFHCQQAVEKNLKAYLVYKKQTVIKTHNLDILLKKCSGFDNDFKDINVKNMEDFAIRARYPHDAIMPSTKETKEYFKIATEIKELVLKKIKL